MSDKSFIYLFDGMFLYVGPGVQTMAHASHALEIGVSLDHTFTIQDDKGACHEARAIMIAPDIENTCSIPVSGRWLHIGIEPESRMAKNLTSKYMTASPLVFLENDLITEFSVKIKQLLAESASIDLVAPLFYDFLNQLQGDLPSEISKELDYRIKKVIRILKESTGEKPSLRELAVQSELSGGRLVHLFKEQVGIPIRRYMLWVRLNRAIMELIHSKNLTEAAHNAGFADSAHFSRTFLRMFGVSPSEIFKNSQIVQAAYAKV